MSFSWGNHVLLDPSDLERMFSDEDSWASIPNIWEELQPEGLLQLDQVKDLLDLLPPREADFIELYFFGKIRQTAIAELFGVSQPTVCYRLQRGAARLKYLVEMPRVSVPDMEAAFARHLRDPVDVAIMVGMYQTTCQSDVARTLKVTQGFVRHRFFRTLDRMAGIPELQEYIEVFNRVAANPNILKNTCRAAWDEDVIHSIQ